MNEALFQWQIIWYTVPAVMTKADGSSNIWRLHGKSDIDIISDLIHGIEFS